MIRMEMQFFMASLWWGVILLLVYDGIRIIRKFIKHTPFLVAVEDVVFWSGGGVLVFIMIYERNDGIIRGFAIGALGIGMIGYHYLISHVVVVTVTGLLQCIFNMLDKLIKWIFRPLKRFFNFGTKLLKKIIKYFVKQLKKITKTVKIAISRK